MFKQKKPKFLTDKIEQAHDSETETTADPIENIKKEILTNEELFKTDVKPTETKPVEQKPIDTKKPKKKRKCSEKQLERLAKMRKRKQEIQDMKKELIKLREEKKQKETKPQEKQSVEVVETDVKPVVKPKPVQKKTETKQQEYGVDYDLLSNKLYHKFLQKLEDDKKAQIKAQQRQKKKVKIVEPKKTVPKKQKPKHKKQPVSALTGLKSAQNNYSNLKLDQSDIFIYIWFGRRR